MLFTSFDLSGPLAALKRSMLKRKQQAFTPGTQRNHVSQIRLYLGFCIKFKLQDINPSTETVCLYIEWLAQNLASPRSVANYLSAVRFLHKWLGYSTESLDSFEVTLLLRSCYATMKHVPLQRRAMSPDMIRELLKVSSECVPFYPVFKCAVLFAFHGFFRMSNLTSRSQTTFDPTKHTCRGDVFVAPPGLVILLKWSKTNQYGQNNELVPLAESKDPALCPVLAFQQMKALVPTHHENQPLLSLPVSQVKLIRPVHPDWLAKMLSTTLEKMGEDPAAYSFHSLRRSGATAAFQAGVQYTQIKKHGCWRSDAFWAYITQASTGHTPVTSALSQL